MPRVSFVVPVFNYDRYLRECLDSILEQGDRFDIEVIAVDDASTDDSRTILASYFDPRLRTIFHEENQGHAKTVEDGLKATTGEFLARIDPDDRLRPNFLSTTVPRLEENPTVGLVYADVALIDDAGKITAHRADTVHKGRDFKGNELVALLRENFICSPTVLARRKTWLDALPVPSGLAFHDWWFTLWIARRFDLYYVDEVVADYRVHPANHHIKIVKDRSEEESLFWLLDRIFSETEQSVELEAAKQRARHSIYSFQYLTLARKYFGLGMYADARKCYLRAIRHHPAYLLRPDVARQLAGTFLGTKRYEQLKRAAPSSRSRRRGPVP